MCTILIGVGTDPRYPVVIAANRDEFYARASTPPQVLQPAGPRIVGGQDGTAGGTWMGVTATGFFVGLTNQRTLKGPATGKISRGHVVLDALRLGHTPAVAAWIQTLDPQAYNPFNLLFGDAQGLRIAYVHDTIRIDTVPSGFSVLPNDVLDSPAFPKVERARRLVDGRLESMEQALADTQTPDPVPPHGDWPPALMAALHRLCVQTPAYGTVSATSVALRPGGIARYAFCDGRPGEASFVDQTALLSDRVPSKEP